MSDDESGGGAFVVGLLAGLATGVALGLLLAPKTGEELREELTAGARTARGKAVDGYKLASERATELAQRGREAVDHLRKAPSPGTPDNSAT